MAGPVSPKASETEVWPDNESPPAPEISTVAGILFKELMLRRRKKILNLVLIAAETGISKQDFNNMLSLEKEKIDPINNKTGGDSLK